MKTVCDQCGSENHLSDIGIDRDCDYGSVYYNGFEGIICYNCLNNGFDGKINETA